MDYGQPVKTDDTQSFSANKNNFDAEKERLFGAKEAASLDNWNVSPSHDPRGIGNTAISLPEEIFTQEGATKSPDSAEVLNPSLMPPGFSQEKDDSQSPESANQASLSAIQYEDKAIKTKENLSSEAIKAIDDCKNKFNSDGNAADFYKNIREELLSKNLDNSFGRKIGEQK